MDKRPYAKLGLQGIIDQKDALVGRLRAEGIKTPGKRDKYEKKFEKAFKENKECAETVEKVIAECQKRVTC